MTTNPKIKLTLSRPLQRFLDLTSGVELTLVAIVFSFLGFGVIQRLFYSFWIYFLAGKFPENLSKSLVLGFAFDTVIAFFCLIPGIFLVFASPQRLFGWRGFPKLFFVAAGTPFLLAIFIGVSEVLFFNEFQSRFNFIAVDYLVYTHEIARNLWESYSILNVGIVGGVLFLLVVFYLRQVFESINGITTWTTRRRSRLGIWVAIGVLLSVALNEDHFLESSEFWEREVAKNSLYALVAAYNRNSIDFHEFYSSLSSPKALKITHEWLEVGDIPSEKDLKEAEASPDEDEHSIYRNIQAPGAEKKWNVVVVVMESMSARFMDSFGSRRGLTPNLDLAAKKGVFFSQLYATGTRTVRGLEALMLSYPPTPGQSILRRPKSENIFQLGDVFEDHGYKTQFIYGGYSYFDNMKAWFSSNGFEIIDRSHFDKEEIQFANAWGVCDEDLFAKVLKTADVNAALNRNFFQVVLTTSNHRPYTYPDGRIDIPSKTGREGAVKYADFAIGKFLQDAKSHSWYANTLFVFVADHNAAVAGGTDIPIQDYLIPMIFYNEKLLSPQIISKLASQIDFAPSLLGFLNFSYQSRFFGENLFVAKGGRALMGTYQKISLMEPRKMTILSPGHRVEELELSDEGKVLKSKSSLIVDADVAPEQVQKTVAIYQTASDLFSTGKSKRDLFVSKKINLRKLKN